MNSTTIFELVINLIAGFFGIMFLLATIAVVATGKVLAALVMLMPLALVLWFLCWYNGVNIKDWFKKKVVK